MQNILQTLQNSDEFNFRYRWEKNGKPFSWQVYDDRISEQPGRGTLVISSPRTEDIGELLIKYKSRRSLMVKTKCIDDGNGCHSNEATRIGENMIMRLLTGIICH